MEPIIIGNFDNDINVRAYLDATYKKLLQKGGLCIAIGYLEYTMSI
jgi:hypothetical protein